MRILKNILLITFLIFAFLNCKRYETHEVHIQLFADKAPVSVKNFYAYIDMKYYDNTVFHRVISNFMIQGGGYTSDLQKKSGTLSSIKNEADNGIANTRGTIAMARRGEINSATSQFFINVVDNANLDYKDDSPRGFGYAVFGKVIKGMDVVDKIRYLKTSRKSFHRNVPKKMALIKSIRRIPNKKDIVSMTVKIEK